MHRLIKEGTDYGYEIRICCNFSRILDDIGSSIGIPSYTTAEDMEMFQIHQAILGEIAEDSLQF
jgi:hypothetical protein